MMALADAALVGKSANFSNLSFLFFALARARACTPTEGETSFSRNYPGSSPGLRLKKAMWAVFQNSSHSCLRLKKAMWAGLLFGAALSSDV